jgi:hypothetical protein
MFQDHTVISVTGCRPSLVCPHAVSLRAVMFCRPHPPASPVWPGAPGLPRLRRDATRCVRVLQVPSHLHSLCDLRNVIDTPDVCKLITQSPPATPTLFLSLVRRSTTSIDLIALALLSSCPGSAPVFLFISLVRASCCIVTLYAPGLDDLSGFVLQLKSPAYICDTPVQLLLHMRSRGRAWSDHRGTCMCCVPFHVVDVHARLTLGVASACRSDLVGEFEFEAKVVLGRTSTSLHLIS